MIRGIKGLENRNGNYLAVAFCLDRTGIKSTSQSMYGWLASEFILILFLNH